MSFDLLRFCNLTIISEIDNDDDDDLYCGVVVTGRGT